MMCHGGTGQPLEEKLRLVAEVPTRPLTRRRVNACGMAAEWLCEAARPEDAELFSVEAVEGARALRDPALEAEALTQLGNVERRLGRYDDAFATLRRARDLAAQSGDLWSIALQAVFEGGTLSEAGRLVEAFEVYAAALEPMGGDRPGPLPFAWAMLTLNLGENALDRGDWQTAEVMLGRLQQAGPIHERSDEYARVTQVRLELWRDGTVPAPDGEQGSLLELADLDTAELQNILGAHRLRLDVLAHVGNLPVARDVFLNLAAVDGIVQMPSSLYPTLLTVARLEADVARGLVPDEDPRWCDDVVDAVLEQLALLEPRSPLQDAFQEHVRADVLRVRGEDTSATWARVVEAWREATDRRSLVLALMRLAETSAAEGLQREARVALVEAMGIATELGAQPLLHDGRTLASRAGIRLPVAAQRRAGGRNPLDLTAREVEILGLVAQGAANKEIAKALVISPRTVSVHLAHINEKLGVQSRTAAVAEAHTRGLLTPELR
jgi:DNA-binding CsgD family transcriptional regulator